MRRTQTPRDADFLESNSRSARVYVQESQISFRTRPSVCVSNPTLLGNAVYLVADVVVALKYTRHLPDYPGAMGRRVVSFTRIIFQQDVNRLSVSRTRFRTRFGESERKGTQWQLCGIRARSYDFVRLPQS